MTTTKTKALVVLSGGQDSTTCLFWAKKYFDEVHAITFDYSQRHSREIQSAEDVSDIAGVDSRELIKLGSGVLRSTSPLTDPNQELETYSDHASMEAIIGNRVEKTFVPMRNALFLTIAANRAVILGATHIVTGVCQEDNANYPDCRQEFIDQQTSAIHAALGEQAGGLMIVTPLMNLSKAASVELAAKLGNEAFAALAYSHTAYDGSYPPVGKDHASILRAKGFEDAGLPDPLVLRAYAEGAMPIPLTRNYADDAVNAYWRARIVEVATKLETF